MQARKNTRRPKKGSRTRKEKTGRGRGFSAMSSQKARLFEGHNHSVQGRIIASESDVTLGFTEIGNFGGAGTGGIARRFTPNGAWDVDPVLGSTATPGFDEYAVFYDYYRVVGYRYEIEIVNRDTIPIIAYVLNTNTDPSTAITNWTQYSMQQYCTSKVMAPNASGQSKVRFRSAYKISQVLGSLIPETDDLYAALVSTTPADLIWCSVGIQPTGSGALANSCDFSIKIFMDIRFYGRKISLLTSSTLSERAKQQEQLRNSWKLFHAARVASGYYTSAQIQQRKLTEVMKEHDEVRQAMAG